MNKDPDMSLARLRGKVQILLSAAAKKGFFHLVSSNLLIGLLGFGSQLIVTKLLSPMELGQIKTVQAFIVIASELALFGFNVAVLKLCSESRPPEEKLFIFKSTLSYAAFTISFILGAVFMLAKLQAFCAERAINIWVSVYMCSIPATVYVSLCLVYLQGLKKMKIMAKAQFVIRTAGFLILMLIIYLFGIKGFFVASILIGYVSLAALPKVLRNSLKIGGRLQGVYKNVIYYSKLRVAGNLPTNLLGGRSKCCLTTKV